MGSQPQIAAITITRRQSLTHFTHHGHGQNEGFSEEQLQMYKDCFKLMDINKDGQLDKNDLRGAFDNVGVLMTEGELDGLLGEVSGPCTCDNMTKMFAEKVAGEGNDPDDLIVQAFKAYDNEGKIDSKMFEHALKTWGDKMTKAEIEDIFGEFEIDEDYMIKTKDVIGLFVSVKEEPKVEEPAPVEEAPEAEPEEEEGRQVKTFCGPLRLQSLKLTYNIPNLRALKITRPLFVSSMCKID